MTKYYSKMPSQRQLMVSQTIKQILASAFSKGDIYHPIFEKTLISVVEVRISPDLRNISAFIAIKDKEYESTIMKLLDYFNSDIRKLVNGNLRLKYLPKIKFIIDDVAVKAARMEEIFSKISLTDK